MPAAALCTLASAADVSGEPKKPDPWLDKPSLVLVSSTTEDSSLAFHCEEQVKTKPRTVHCVAAMTMVSAPDPAQIAESIRSWDDMRKRPEAAKFMKETCAASERAVTSGTAVDPEKLVMDRVANACRSSDKGQFWDAMKWGTTEVEGKTCEVRTLVVNEYDFAQLDANTWQATTAGFCPGMGVLTLWRKPGDHFWNYKQVSSMAPNGGPLCPVPKNPVSEYRWDARKTRDLRCVYLKI